MTVQNGLGAEEVVRRHGDWPLISAVTFMSGNRRGDAEVEYILDTETWLGPYGDTPYETVERTADLIVRSGLKARPFEDLRPAQWSKLIFNATVNSVSALTHLPHDPHFADRRSTDALGHLVHELVEEGQRVAAAAGVDLHDDPWEMNVLATQRGSAHAPSMLEDIEAGRPTEIDLITGALVREAERTGVPVPLHEAMYALVRAKEQSCVSESRMWRGGEPFAAHLAQLDDVEVWAYDLDAGTSTRSTRAGSGSPASATSSVGCGRRATRPTRRATSGSLRSRACTPTRHWRRPRMRSRRAPSARFRTGSATRS